MNDFPDIISILTQQSRPILYYPLLNQITGHALASILLQQILYWRQRQEGKPFYKFAAPCQHPAYRPGDSWQEELGFSRTEFETARRRLGKKVSRGKSKKAIQVNHLVSYWTDSQHLTWYDLNEVLLAQKLQALANAELPPFLGNAEKLHYLDSAENLPELGNADKSHYPEDAAMPQYLMQVNDNTLFTERSTEKTTKREPAPSSLVGKDDGETASAAADESQTAVSPQQHPAIVAWRHITRRYPRQETWHLIMERLGQSPDLDRLQRVISNWIGSGYRPDNVLGILDWYEREQSQPGWLTDRTAVSSSRTQPLDAGAQIGLIPTVTVVGGRF
jgi:hypothetical protein